LTSWLRELDGFFPEQLPFSTYRIGRTCFTTMAVTENYYSTPHMDRDLSNSVISWFLESKCALLHVSVLNTSSFLKKIKNKKIAGFHLHTTIVNMFEAWIGEAKSGGEFAFPTHEMFFKPQHGTTLFRSAWLQHCTMPVRDRRRQLGYALYLRKQTLTHYVTR
jgi:hypothetical protein